MYKFMFPVVLSISYLFLIGGGGGGGVDVTISRAPNCFTLGAPMRTETGGPRHKR